MVFAFIQTYISLPSLGRMCTKPKACNQIKFFTPEYAHVCDALGNHCLNYQCKIFTISNIKWINSKSFYEILLPGDISLSPGRKNNVQLLDSSDWNVFKSKGLHLIYLNINSVLPKIDKLRYIANSSNVAVIEFSESKLDESPLQSEIQINNYDLMCRDRKRNDEGVACYVTSDISYIQKQYFPEEIENIFFKFFYLKQSQ